MKLPVQPEYDISLAKPAHDLAARWDAARVITDLKKLDFKDSDIKDFSSNQKGVPSFVFCGEIGVLSDQQ